MKFLYKILIISLGFCSCSDKVEQINELQIVSEGGNLNYILKKNKILLYPNISVSSQKDSIIFIEQDVNHKYLKEFVNKGIIPEKMINNTSLLRVQLNNSKLYWMYNLNKDSLIGPIDEKSFLELK